MKLFRGVPDVAGECRCQHGLSGIDKRATANARRNQCCSSVMGGGIGMGSGNRQSVGVALLPSLKIPLE